MISLIEHAMHVSSYAYAAWLHRRSLHGKARAVVVHDRVLNGRRASGAPW